MCAQAATYLLDHGGLNTIGWLPPLDLNSHSRPNDFADDECPPNVDAAVLTSLRDFNIIETNLSEKPGDQLLKFRWVHRQ